nr:ribonuclease H-like domain-containing protein [Tanacetum cinerariifolium]
MDQQNPTLAKIQILDTRKFEQWQFRIQQYLQHEHYALWEVIEFRDSYEVPTSAETTETASGGTGKKTGRTVTVTTEDMEKRKNDVKERTTLLLSLPDEHQLRFSKYKTAQELWAAILKTFGGNEATKKTKKNLLKQQYGNFKAEGSETLEQTFNRLSDLDTMSLDDLYNHLKVYESEVQKKSKPNSQNMAFISSAKHNRGNEDVNPASVSTASTIVPTASANNEVAKDHVLVADEEAPIEFALMSNTSPEIMVFDNSLCFKDLLAQVESRLVEHKEREIKYCEKIKGLELDVNFNTNKFVCIAKELETLKKEKEGVDGRLAGFLTALKDLDNLIESQRSNKNKEGLGYSAKISTGGIKFTTADMGKKGKAGSSQNNIDDKGYWDSNCSRHMTGNISYLSDYEPFDGGYVSFGQGGCKITGKGTITTECIVLGRDFKLLDDANILLRTPRQHNMYSIDLNNIVPYKDLTCLVVKASADECMLWHRRLVDAGTNSTNLSGTKDAANQEVKKNVFSLRYITLSNWVHDALLESSSIESPIPTVSSPVLTACFNDSPEPLSDARLISKRVSNQVETPSLNNILTLSNWFEDILGVITNSDESNGVEVDVNNMETTITASPTPTLRIHKDHPKSQIIGHVDTPI